MFQYSSIVHGFTVDCGKVWQPSVQIFQNSDLLFILLVNRLGMWNYNKGAGMQLDWQIITHYIPVVSLSFRLFPLPLWQIEILCFLIMDIFLLDIILLTSFRFIFYFTYFLWFKDMIFPDFSLLKWFCYSIYKGKKLSISDFWKTWFTKNLKRRNSLS